MRIPGEENVRWSVEVCDMGTWIWLEWPPTRELARQRVRELRSIKPTSLVTSRPRRYRVGRWVRSK